MNGLTEKFGAIHRFSSRQIGEWHRIFPAVLCALALTACGPRPDAGEHGAAAAEVAALKPSNAMAAKLLQVVEEYYDHYLALNPLQATAQGDHRFDARFGDYVTITWMADSLGIEQESLEKLQSINPRKLHGEDLVTYEAFKRGREINIEGYRFPSELLPVQQFSNLASSFAVAGSGQGIQPFRTAQDYDNFLSRMDGFAAWVDHAIANMRQGVEKGVVQPRIVVERTLPQLEAQLVDDPKQSIFWRPILNFPAGISVPDRQRLTKAYADRIATQVLPAYRRLHDFLKNEYLPHARASIGMSDLPNGASWYAYLVRYHTGTSMTPDEVHRLGLSEVTRIRADMERIKNQVGHAGDLRSFFDALRTDPRFYYHEASELLAGYGAIRQRVEPALPLLFAVKPKTSLEIRAVEAFRAPTEASASYEPASADGKRPGVFYVNTYDLASRPTYAMEALFLHEGVPGHHLQISVAQEAANLPRFRRFAWDTAYGEGWALYAESLGRDLGLYTDPYNAFGALSNEMWRAVRLVVDTGIHSKGWTREQAIDYFRANTALGDADIAAEVDRYIAWPGQALAYKVGQLEILKLRQRAQQKLGAQFDIRAFHSQILESGSLPLTVLDAKIDRWLAGK
ncbi:MAG: DUF885 domain-containing protein [Gammaproteobacteria bacterium]|nr:DUF885 domain-containing protein [Gammaproteobacteria bacterium]